MTPIEQIISCLKSGQNFVLQGGAGSGKTETLKQIISFISESHPNQSVACITHTNLAADEIKSRVEGNYTISTIHSFLNNLIKDFKINIHEVIDQLFKLEPIQALSLKDFEDEKELKKAEHDNYKKIYEKYAKLLFKVQGASVKKVTGKRDYEKQKDIYNSELNKAIEELNDFISQEISKRDPRRISYNETKFNSFKDLTYGHDGLLEITALLFTQFPLLSRILQDKYDYIFIDEFQDTHPDIIEIFLKKLITSKRTTIGLFGDSMQGIYEDGVGDVNKYIENKTLLKIPKLDNFRCSNQVIDFLNHHRVPVDGLRQNLAIKIKDGIPEPVVDRQGSVTVYYGVYPYERPNNHSRKEDKAEYQNYLMKLIEDIETANPLFKKLMLTNKSISKKVGFDGLFKIFDDRYTEVNDEIEVCLEKLNLSNLAELCIAFKNKNINFVISELRKAGFILQSIEDKQKITRVFETLSNNKLSLTDALTIGIDRKLIKESDSYCWYIKRKDDFLLECSLDQEFHSFKTKYLDDCNTFAKFLRKYPKHFDESTEYTGKEQNFLKWERVFKKEQFYEQLFSDSLKFNEVISFFEYMNEQTDFITMHKTKGSGIDNVLVAMDDFFWSKYQFKTLFDTPCEKPDMKLKMQKLFYVACSRAKKNLICVRLLVQGEEDDFINSFPESIQIIKL